MNAKKTGRVITYTGKWPVEVIVLLNHLQGVKIIDCFQRESSIYDRIVICYSLFEEDYDRPEAYDLLNQVEFLLTCCEIK